MPPRRKPQKEKGLTRKKKWRESIVLRWEEKGRRKNDTRLEQKKREKMPVKRKCAASFWPCRQHTLNFFKNKNIFRWRGRWSQSWWTQDQRREMKKGQRGALLEKWHDSVRGGPAPNSWIYKVEQRPDSHFFRQLDCILLFPLASRWIR